MIVDLIIVAVIILCVAVGYKKGLVEVAFRLVSFIVAIGLSLMLYGPVSNYIISNTELDDNIKQSIVQNINPEDYVKSETEENNEKLPEIVSNYIEKTIKEVASNAKESAADLIATNISITAVKIISLLGIFILLRLLLGILKIITNLIAKLPIINSANKIGGIIYGLLEGLLIVYILLAILMAISSITGNAEVLVYVNESIIGKIMFNNNILLKIILP